MDKADLDLGTALEKEMAGNGVCWVSGVPKPRQRHTLGEVKGLPYQMGVTPQEKRVSVFFSNVLQLLLHDP